MGGIGAFFTQNARWLTLALMGLALILLISLGRNIWLALTETWGQLLAAGFAAVVMGGIGRWLTLGRGVLAGSSQYDRLLVWSALGLSVVSAITTTTGLQNMFSANESTAAVLPVLLACLLGVSVQAFMLNNALRIGEGLQRFVPHEAARDIDDDWADAEVPRRRVRRISFLMSVVLFGALVLGIAITMDLTLSDLGQYAMNAISASEEATGINPLGPALILVALILLSRTGILPAVATLTGLTVSLAVYLAMLLFSSGFGYMFYFVSVQTEEVIATDRNAYIRDRTPALVNQIREAARLDVDDALVEATSGTAIDDLSDRMNVLAGIFRSANDSILAAQAEYNLNRQRLAEERERAAQSIAEAEAEIIARQEAVVVAQARLQAALDDQARRAPGLEQERDEAIDRRDAELIGDESGTGVAGRGPEYRRFNELAESIQRELDEIAQGVAEARVAVAQAEAAEQVSRDRLTRLRSEEGGELVEDPLPPPIVDPESFTTPLAEYAVAPTPERLAEVARACNAGVQLLIAAGENALDLPDCEVSAVQASFTRWQRARDALEQVEQPGVCIRTEEELAADSEGRRNAGAADPDAIPQYLQDRVQWVVRCMDAANTGSDRMQGLVRQVARMESEYLTSGFDLRRIISAPFEGNRFALFAVLLAVVIDTAILFAGIGANAQRGKTLKEDHRLVTADRLSDRIRNILSLRNPQSPGLVATAILYLSTARPHVPGTQNVFTKELDVSDPTIRDAERKFIELLMTAAGPEFARRQQIAGRSVWLLHRNLVALLVEIAGTSGQETAAGAAGGGGTGLIGLGGSAPVSGAGFSSPSSGPGQWGRAISLGPNYATGSARPESEPETDQQDTSRPYDPFKE